MKYIAILLMLFSLKSCGNTKHTESAMQKKPDQIFGNYIITTISNDTLDIDTLTITFEEGTNRVSGYSGCNRFTGTFEIHENNLKFGPIAATKMLCAEVNNTIEQQFFEALSKTNQFSVENGTLKLLNDTEIMLVASKTAPKEKISQSLNYTIEYTAVSRGFFKVLKVENNTISAQNDRSSKPLIRTCTSNEEKKLDEMISSLDLKTLETLEIPSKAHQYDGAAIATLKIINKEGSYETPSFDHGNPPKEIEALVNQLVSMTEKVE